MKIRAAGRKASPPAALRDLERAVWPDREPRPLRSMTDKECPRGARGAFAVGRGPLVSYMFGWPRGGASYE